MFFHFSSPDAVDVGHVDSVVVQPSGELEALEWMRGAIEWMLRYVKIHRSSTSTWNQFHLKSILDLTWFCTLLLVKSESWNQISDWNQNELNYSSFEFFVTWLPFTNPLRFVAFLRLTGWVSMQAQGMMRRQAPTWQAQKKDPNSSKPFAPPMVNREWMHSRTKKRRLP